MEKQFEKNAKIFKALSDPNRLWIVDTLQHGERCACMLLEMLDVGQSTLSHHMKILTDARIVNVRKDGKWSHYSLSQEGIELIKQYINGLNV
ncbi:MAG: metalloregulator ArsR/SmtB family transcription factor [Coprobacillus sp.]